MGLEIGWFFFVLNPAWKALNISSISDVYHNSFELHFITREQDLKLGIYDNNLVNAYDHLAAHCTLRRRA